MNGRGISVRLSTGSPLTRTSKQPFLGLSSLTLMDAEGIPALTRFSSFVALVLKAPQDLHASMAMRASFDSSDLAGLAFLSAAGAAVAAFLLGGIVLGSLRRLSPTKKVQVPSFQLLVELSQSYSVFIQI